MTLPLILFYFFICAVVVQLIYYLFLFSQFAFTKQTSRPHQNHAVSIIIAAKNEAKNLKENLPVILNQHYPNFEVILIDDASTDSTLQVMQLFKNEKKQLKIIDLPNTHLYKGNKKNAITKGIAAANFEYLLFTDADCKPNSQNWISEMSAHFNKNKSIVLGFGGYEKIVGSFLNKLIRYETVLTAIQYFSYAKAGIPYMGVGRNLAYHKTLFKNENGFTSHAAIKSGDDDLFISAVATSKNTAISTHKNSFTYSKPMITLKSWFAQKRRHISTSDYYKTIHKNLLGLFYVSQFLFWTLAIILIVSSFKWQLVMSLLILRLICQYFIMGKAAKKLGENELIYLFPLLDVIIVFLQFTIYISTLIKKPTSW